MQTKTAADPLLITLMLSLASAIEFGGQPYEACMFGHKKSPWYHRALTALGARQNLVRIISTAKLRKEISTAKFSGEKITHLFRASAKKVRVRDVFGQVKLKE